jgi:hypothetical protein
MGRSYLLLTSALTVIAAIWLVIAARGQFDEIALKVDRQRHILVEVSRQAEPLSSDPVRYLFLLIPGVLTPRFLGDLFGGRIGSFLSRHWEKIALGLALGLVLGLGYFLTRPTEMPADYAGVINAPRKVYAQSSSRISVNLQAERLYAQLKLAVPISLTKLEVEMDHAGFPCDGDQKQQHFLSDRTLYYRWSCHFNDSGEYLLDFAFRGITGAGTSQLLADASRPVTVVKLFGLTAYQMWIVAAISGTMGFTGVVVGLLKK